VGVTVPKVSPAGSEVCWRFEPDRRAAGERVATAYRTPVTR
jgi:hypothetical protein